MGVQAVETGKQKETGSVQGTALTGVSRDKEMGKGKQANWFQKHSMKKTLLLQIGFRKSTQWICWHCWPGQNATELSQIITECRKAQCWEATISLIQLEKNYWVGDKSQETRKPDRDVTADTCQSTGEHCCVPDARTPHLHALLQMSAPAVQPTLDTPFSLRIYPSTSRLTPNLDFSSIQPWLSNR